MLPCCCVVHQRRFIVLSSGHIVSLQASAGISRHQQASLRMECHFIMRTNDNTPFNRHDVDTHSAMRVPKIDASNFDADAVAMQNCSLFTCAHRIRIRIQLNERTGSSCPPSTYESNRIFYLWAVTVAMDEYISADAPAEGDRFLVVLRFIRFHGLLADTKHTKTTKTNKKIEEEQCSGIFVHNLAWKWFVELGARARFSRLRLSFKRYKLEKAASATVGPYFLCRVNYSEGAVVSCGSSNERN